MAGQVAHIKLSTEERQRILKELEVEGGDVDWLPETIEIHRASPDDDVSGFLNFSASPPVQISPSKFQPTQAAKVPAWVLVAL